MTWAEVGGAVVAVPVALIGLWGVRISGRRQTQQEREQEGRLRLDAAMEAAKLFGPEEAASSTAAAKAAGLLALVQLGQADLAVALLVDVWSSTAPEVTDGEAKPGESAGDAGTGLEPQVSTETAILVLDEALRSIDAPNAQLVAAELLCRNAHRLKLGQSLHWPAAIDGSWLPDLAVRAKLLLMDALIQTSVHSTPNENALRVLVSRLHGVSAGDPDPRVKGCVGKLIDDVLPAIRELGYAEFMGNAGLIHLSDLEAAAALASPNPDGYLERQVDMRGKRLGEWAHRCEPCSAHPGTLAIPG